MYPGNHTDSEILYAPRYLKTRPGAPQTQLAYVTPEEEGILAVSYTHLTLPTIYSV